MYSNKLVVAIKSRSKNKGRILREDANCVSLPFGSEYSIFIKNLNSRKASINVSIDGEDVLDGKALLIDPNRNTELKGFLNNTTAKNRFKFIEKTEQISGYRGDRIDDGIVRVEFAFEKEKQEAIIYPGIKYKRNDLYWDSETLYSDMSSIKYCSCDTNSIAYDAGITVKGTEINQNFDYGTIDELGNKHVIIIKLVGKKNDNTVIERPIVINTKLICPTCGKKSSSIDKFCSRCGTHLR